MFYDILMRRRVDLPALARASAGLTECVAGIRLHSTGRAGRVSPDGREASAPPLPASATAPITLDVEEIGTAWLERPGAPGPLDDVLVDRLAIAAAGRRAVRLLTLAGAQVAAAVMAVGRVLLGALGGIDPAAQGLVV